MTNTLFYVDVEFIAFPIPYVRTVYFMEEPKVYQISHRTSGTEYVYSEDAEESEESFAYYLCG